MEIHPLQKLDAILTFINSHQEAINRLMSFDEIKQGIGNSNITEYELTNILLKLERDKYIEIDEHVKNNLTKHLGATVPIPTAAGCYRISFEGQVFNKFEGYVNKYNRENREKEIAIRNERWLKIGSVWAAIAASFLFLLELVKFVQGLIKHHCHH
ncbi:MAG: hypothetical protein ACYDCN_14025 [Bacteroidia bacterium]